MRLCRQSVQTHTFAMPPTRTIGAPAVREDCIPHLLSHAPMLRTSGALASLGGHWRPATPLHQLLGSWSCPAVVLLSDVASKKLILGLVRGTSGCGSHAKTCNPWRRPAKITGLSSTLVVK